MYVILGCGSVGYNVAQLLAGQGKEVLIFDRDPQRVEDLRERGFDAAQADIATAEPSSLKLDEADAVLVLTRDGDVNAEATRTIKAARPAIFVLARARDPVAVETLEEAGADHVLHTSHMVARSLLRELDTLQNKMAIEELTDILEEATEGGVGVFLHNSPDPDTLASGLALKTICEEMDVECELFYGGTIGYQENRAFVNLISIPLHRVEKHDDILDIVNGLDKIVLIECANPGQNNVLPKDVVPNIVIDHHQVDKAEVKADFQDIRPNVGATSTILTKYLQQLDINLKEKPELATALLYGIRTDTMSFTRNTSSADLEAAAFLSPMADLDLLKKIENPPMDTETLDVFGRAVQNRELTGSYMISNVGFIRNRDTLPQAAEFLLKLEGISTVLVFGIVDEVIHLSARSDDVRVNLATVLQRAFGKENAGGHPQSAAGQVRLGIFSGVEERDALLELVHDAVKKQFLQAVGVDEKKKSKKPKEE